MNKKAFTLIELLVVVAIIGILAAVGVVAYNGYTASAKEKTTQMNFRNINKSLMIEFMKCELDGSNIVFIRSLNYQWEIDDLTLPYYKAGKDKNNIHFSLKISYLLGQ